MTFCFVKGTRVKVDATVHFIPEAVLHNAFDEGYNFGYKFSHTCERVRVAYTEAAHVFEEFAFPICRCRAED